MDEGNLEENLSHLLAHLTESVPSSSQATEVTLPALSSEPNSETPLQETTTPEAVTVTVPEPSSQEQTSLPTAAKKERKKRPKKKSKPRLPKTCRDDVPTKRKFMYALDQPPFLYCAGTPFYQERFHQSWPTLLKQYAAWLRALPPNEPNAHRYFPTCYPLSSGELALLYLRSEPPSEDELPSPTPSRRKKTKITEKKKPPRKSTLALTTSS